MISVSLWQVVIFVLAGVAVGAIVTILVLARGSRSDRPESVAVQSDHVADSLAAQPVHQEKSAEQVHQTRVERVTAILRDCIAKKRNLTISETAKILAVSPRRVRRLLDSGTLIPVPTTDGSRLVSAVSVLDLVAHFPGERTLMPAGWPAGADGRSEAQKQVKSEIETAAPERIDVAAADNAIGLALKTSGELKPGPNQLYWYYVEGHDKPLRSIREALGVMGLNYAYTEWAAIPKNVRDKMKRERVQRGV